MKPVKKAILIGCLIFVVLWSPLLLRTAVSSSFGEAPLLSILYYPLYMAFALLIALVISCTYLIVSKLNQLLNK